MTRLIFLLVVLASAALAAADSTDDLIRSVENRYNGAKTLTVDFAEQYSVLGRPRRPESGRLALRKQGKMRWDYDHPAGKLFISDGKTVFLYTAADHRVARMPMKQTDDMRAPIGFLLGKLDLKKEFRDFQARVDGHGQRLQASAKSDRVPYTNIEMLIGDAGAIEELTVHGRDQSTLTFFFKNERLNPPLPDTLFQFAIPPGTEVVDAIASQAESQ